MKSSINYYYNLFPHEIIKQNNFCYFWDSEDKYYFVPFNNDLKIFEKTYQYLKMHSIKVNEVIFNKDNNLLTNYKGKNYVLLKVCCIENELVDIWDFYRIIMENESGINWGVVWEQKIDYLEYQVSQRALGKENILNSFSYYIGMAENAIQYYKLLNISDVSVGIQHKRVYSKNYEINYYNPINMIIDYNVRDIAEYIKFSFFARDLNEETIFQYIDKLNLSNDMMNLLFVRLLFPSYYFDHYERLLNEEEHENELLSIINLASLYEKFLKRFYLYYENRYKLFKIDWIVTN